MLVPLTWEVARALLRGDIGVDVIALLAMASALAAGEQLAGAIVALMLSGGNALEDYAAGRARRDLTALLERAPRVAQRRVGDTWEEVAVDSLVPGRRRARAHGRDRRRSTARCRTTRRSSTSRR